MKPNIVIVITLFRSLLATSLGLVLLFQPAKTTPKLGNFMGIFWLASGVIGDLERNQYLKGLNQW
jgi:uncharacterized membrane protein HdeD (DUF308 family)